MSITPATPASLLDEPQRRARFGSLETAYLHLAPATAANDGAVVFVHGFGACKEHWRHNLPALAQSLPCYALDLIGFGASSKPPSMLEGESADAEAVRYCVDFWAEQVERFVQDVVQQPVQLIGNSIGGVVALAAAERLERSGHSVRQVILVDCAQRSIDEKRVAEQPPMRRLGRPLLKSLMRQRWLTNRLFASLARPGVIRKVLEIAYPTKQGVDDRLVELLLAPTRDAGAAESFRGFINLFDDRLAPDLLAEMQIPVRMLWGARDPWEPLQEAQRWASTYPDTIRELVVLDGLGHCPHDEAPEQVNPVLQRWVQAPG
jgi:pimeloyl-ACP methyl ester carboxylesterase